MLLYATMTLEDFFTLTEIRDGLMVTSRVEELVSVMRRNDDSVLKNAGDAYRQWTAVASTLAATKNRECLDVFVNLGGLLYLGSWLAEAQMLVKDSVERPIEESILTLLEAFQNIGVDSSRLVSSGIWSAVKKLVDHGSSRVQDQARKLFGSWNDNKADEHSGCDTETCSKVQEDRETSGQISTITLCSSFPTDCAKRLFEIADEALLSRSLEENNPDLELRKDVQEAISVDEKFSMKKTIGPTIFGIMPSASSSLQYPVSDCFEAPSNGLLDSEISKENKMGISGNSCRAVAVTSSPAGHVLVSSDSIIASIELEKNSVLQSSLDSNEVSRNVPATLSGLHDVSIAHNSNPVPSVTLITDITDSENSSGLSGHGRNRIVKNNHMAAHAEKEGKKDDKHHSNRKKRINTRKSRSSSRSMTVSQCLGTIDRTTADIELGIVDALDVATRVAQEVAREVDSGEPSRSISVELSDESGSCGSQDSQDDVLHTSSPFNGLSMGENLSFEEPHAGYNDVMDDKIKKSENGMLNSDDVEERLVAAAVAKSEVGRNKSPCNFDLNQDLFPDERDVIMSAVLTTASTTTTTIISVSHSVSTFGMPVAAPLQSERTLSGNESAATSVYNSALPRKVPSGDFREKQVIFRGIDLNVVEVGDDQVEDSTPCKQLPSSSSNCRSGESSHEANPWGSGRFNLDLNCMTEDYDMPPPSELKMETRLFLSHSAQQSASPTSLSSVQQGNGISFDLNDRPQLLVDSSDLGPYHWRHPWNTADHGGHQYDEPVISILGKKVDVDRKDSASQTASLNGRFLEPTTGLDMARMGNSLGLAPCASFSPTSIYGYNGLTGPTGVSKSSPMYVPGTAIPYMLDSRGTPAMMSDTVGSTPYVQRPFPQQHMFMSLAGGSPSLKASVQPNIDQSSRFGVGVGNRESISMRQFLSLEQIGAMGEHSGGNAEPSSSSSFSVGRKRKEPETRFEFPPWR